MSSGSPGKRKSKEQCLDQLSPSRGPV